jgi:nucleotide-binding universal stress UspA family protein
MARKAAGSEALLKEIGHGYDIAFVGIDKPFAVDSRHFEDMLQTLVAAFKGPVAIALNGAGSAGPVDVPLDILLPASGRQNARLAVEMALALADASRGTVTALHVFDPHDDTALLRGRARRHAISVLVDVHRLGKRAGVAVKGLTATNTKAEAEIRHAVRAGTFDLLVLHTSLRQGRTRFLGSRIAGLLGRLRVPVLLIAH